MPVRLHLLGSATVEAEGRLAALPFERRSQLLAFLALKRSWVGRAELAAMLWPEQPNKLALTNLRKTIFRLQSLAWAQELEADGGALRFRAETDVFAFESALREKRLGEALRWHRGELLPGFDDDASEAWSSWLAFERQRLRSAWRAAALTHLEEDIEPSEAIALSARLLEDDPLDEAALRAHMAWLGREGQSAQARQAYRAFTERLSEELGIAPGAQLQALHDSLANGIAKAIVPAAAPRDDGFVGRSIELRRVASLLSQPECRLVSIIGAGGVGKTRLARRAVEELATEHPDGAVFVALEQAIDAGDVLAAIARELGLALAARGDPYRELVEFIGDGRMLLALDNFEQLAHAAPLIDHLLSECASLRILVTSRMRLGLAREQLLPLEGLPCPDAEDEDRLEAFDAVRLFVRAARRLEPAFVPEIEAASIVEICRAVEGLPLALELAAGWTRVLSCEAIAAQLREGTQLLESADASHPPRHASMEVVFDQSWRLLSPVERDAVARLSIFHGGFSAEAAKSVANATVPVLGALVDKSLLRNERGRLHMHPLLHHLAADRLERSSVAGDTHRAHALHFHRLMAQHARRVEDGNREALETIDAEWQNCRIAWRWAIAHERLDLLTRSVRALLHFCDHRARQEECLALLRESAAAEGVRKDRKLNAFLLACSAHLEYRLDRYAQAEADAMRALASTELKSDHDTRLQCFKVLGGCCLRLGRLAEARHFFKQALRQAPASVDPNSAAGMLDNLALVAKSMGDYDESLRLSLESLVQHQILDDPAGEALCRNNLAAMYLDRADFGSARAHLDEGLALAERHGLAGTRALVLANMTELAVKTGDVQAAAEHARRALEAAQATRQRAIVSWLRLQTAELARQRGDLAAARADLAAAMEIAIALGRPSLQWGAIQFFAELLLAQGEREAARRVLQFAAEHGDAGAPQRQQFQDRLAALPAAPPREWPGLGLEELSRRIVVERGVDHAPLIALLR